MRTEQPTKCFVPFQKLRVRLAQLNRFKPPVVFYITYRSKAVRLILFSVFACVLFSPTVCLDGF